MTAERILGTLNGYAVPLPAKPVEPDWSEIDGMLAAAKFDLGKSPGQMDYILKIVQDGKEVGVGGRGMIGLVMGAEKSRKTNFLKGMVAAGLSGEQFLNIKLDIELDKAVYFDTEQPQQYFWKTQFQAHILGKQCNNSPKYHAYTMRKWSTEQRLLGIERFLETNPETAVCVIDGLLDLVDDFNSIHESKKVVQRLMNWSELPCQPLILGVIHTNRGMKGELKKSMGMFGSMLDKKCDFGIMLTYDAKTDFTTVQHTLPRGKRFSEWEFTMNADGFPILNHHQKIELLYPYNLDQPPTDEKPPF